MAFFVESLKGEEPSQFDTTMSQFMECAQACRQAKLDERSAAETASQAERFQHLEQLEQLARENELLESQLGTAEGGARKIGNR